MDDEIIGMDVFSPEMMENLRKVSKGLKLRHRLRNQGTQRQPVEFCDTYTDEDLLAS